MAPRDMTARQFEKALDRNGFRLAALWLQDLRLRGVFHGLVLKPGGRGIDRRASLAKALQHRSRIAKDRDLTPKEGP